MQRKDKIMEKRCVKCGNDLTCLVTGILIHRTHYKEIFETVGDLFGCRHCNNIQIFGVPSDGHPVPRTFEDYGYPAIKLFDYMKIDLEGKYFNYIIYTYELNQAAKDFLLQWYGYWDITSFVFTKPS